MKILQDQIQNKMYAFLLLKSILFFIFSLIFFGIDLKKGSSVPEDLAIHVDPNYVPVLLFSQINRLAATYKCFVKFHVHGTVLINEYKNNSKIFSRVENLKELFNKLKVNMNESRLKYDFGFTFVWKTGLDFLLIKWISLKTAFRVKYTELRILRASLRHFFLKIYIKIKSAKARESNRNWHKYKSIL